MAATSSIPEQRILQCVDAGLQALGDSGKYITYHYLEKNFGLKQNEIPEKPEAFCRAVTSILGDAGAAVIEEWILQKMKQNFKLNQPSKLTFVRAVLIVKAKQK